MIETKNVFKKRSFKAITYAKEIIVFLHRLDVNKPQLKQRCTIVFYNGCQVFYMYIENGLSSSKIDMYMNLASQGNLCKSFSLGFEFHFVTVSTPIRLPISSQIPALVQTRSRLVQK